MRTAFDLSFQEWEPRLFIRLGSHSLLLDLPEGLFEVNGRPVRWFGWSSGHLNPLEALGESTPLEAPADPRMMAIGDALGQFAREAPASGVAGSMKLFSAAILLAIVLGGTISAPGQPWETRGFFWDLRYWAFALVFISAGLVVQAVGVRVRGISSTAYAVLWWLGFAAIGHPWMGWLASPFIFVAGLSRFLNPWLGPLVIPLFAGVGQGPMPLILLPGFAMAVFLTIQESRRFDRIIPIPVRTGMSDLAKGAEALSRSRIWMQAAEGGPLTDAFMLKAGGIALPGGLPIWFLESGADTLTFLPGALLWVREGYKAKLVSWEAVRLQSQPCVWQNPPDTLDLGPEQWMLRIRIPGTAPWTFIVGHAIWGQRCSTHWSRALPTEGPTGNATAPPNAPVHNLAMLEAYRVLGLPSDATPGQVRKAYRQLAKIHHPDAHPDASAASRQDYEAQMQAINEAYAILREGGAA